MIFLSLLYLKKETRMNIERHAWWAIVKINYNCIKLNLIKININN